MRTTLDIEDDVLQSARSLSMQQGVSLGRVISSLARAALKPQASSVLIKNGVPVLPLNGKADSAPDLELINHLRDDGS